MLSRDNYPANSFNPPPFVPLNQSRGSSSAHYRNPRPPPRRPIVSHAAATLPAHQIVQLELQRPMGIVFAPNEEAGYGVCIIDMPQQGAAAVSQQLYIGDVLISVNGRDCTESNSKEVMALIGQAEGNVQLSFLRISVPEPAAAASAEEEYSFGFMQVASLHWQDDASGLRGRYDGTVNQHMRPHGNGRFTADQGYILEGEWEDGDIVEVKSFPTGANNAIASSASLHSQSRNESMSCATSLHTSSGISLSDNPDYPDAKQERLQQPNNNGQSQEDLSSQQSSSSSSSVQVYCLGETLRSPQHMVQMASVEDTVQSVYALQISDFAFIMRSKGDWTFCQLVGREDNEEGEDVMTFVVNEVGHRKSLRPFRWVKMVKACSNGIMVRPGGAAVNDIDF